MKLSLCVVVVLAGTGVASADLVPIPEFIGERSEGFEAVGGPQTHTGPLSILGGTATMEDTLAHIAVVAFNWFGPAGTVLPFQGGLFGGTVAGSSMFLFSTPQKAFGGFMNTVGTAPGGTAVFRDASGAVVGSTPINVNPVTWAWQGWRSDAAFSSVEIIGAGVPGLSTLYDNIQVSSIPAPGGAMVVAAGLGLMGRRRRGR